MAGRAKVRGDSEVSAAELALRAAARKYARDCEGASVAIDVFRLRVQELRAAARLFSAAEERRDLEVG